MIRGFTLGALPPLLLFLSEVRGHSLLLHREVGLHLRDRAPLQCGECFREQQILVVSLDQGLVDGGEVAELLEAEVIAIEVALEVDQAYDVLVQVEDVDRVSGEGFHGGLQIGEDLAVPEDQLLIEVFKYFDKLPIKDLEKVTVVSDKRSCSLHGLVE